MGTSDKIADKITDGIKINGYEIQPEPTSPEETGEITATVQVPADSIWFSGHFPTEPILPGIAQMAMVADVLQQNRPFSMKDVSFHRVRFKRITRPGDRIHIRIMPDKKTDGSYAFRLSVKDELACSGTLRTGKIS